MLGDQCVLCADCPAVPVLFRTMRSKGKKKQDKKYKYVDITFAVEATMPGTPGEPTLFYTGVQPWQDRMVILSKHTGGCLQYFEQTYAAMEAGLWDARTYC